MPNRNDWEKVILTYKDNEALSPEIVASIEQRKTEKVGGKYMEKDN